MKRLVLILLTVCLTAATARASFMGQFSGVLAGYRAPQAPNAPTGVTAAAGNTKNTVSWSAGVTDGTHDAPTSYTLYGGTSASPTSSIYTGSATSYTHTGLTNNTPYYYRLTATNAAGTSGYSSPDATATPATSFTDAFTASDWSAPNPAYWASLISPTSGNLRTGSYFNIQSNALKAYVGSTSGSARLIYKTTFSVSYNNANYLQFKQVAPLGSNANDIYVWCLYNANATLDSNGFPTNNFVYGYLNSGQLTLGYTNPSGTDAGPAGGGTYTGANNDVIRFAIQDSTHMRITVNGSTAGIANPVMTHTANLGTDIKAAVYLISNRVDGTFSTYTIDDFVLQ